MAPNKKKKKPTSNPARGFTTVSVPSRPKVIDSTAVSSAAESSVTPSEGERSPPSVETGQLKAAQENDKSLQSYSPEELEKHLEDAELQSVVERYSSRCKSDASRQVSRLETERRLLRSQSNLLNMGEWIPQEILDQIIRFAQMEDESRDPLPERNMNSAKEEDLSIKLWTLRDTFMKLGFSDSRVEELLKYIVTYRSGLVAGSKPDMTWNIEESLDWLALRCNPEELSSYDKVKTSLSGSADTATSWISGKLNDSLGSMCADFARQRIFIFQNS
jgi:ATP-dependent RNA helicase DHX29